MTGSQLVVGLHLVAAGGGGQSGPAGIKFTPRIPAQLQSSASSILGWTAGIVLGVILAAFLVSAACWAWGGHSGRPDMHTRGKMGTLYSLIGVFLVGAASLIVNMVYGL